MGRILDRYILREIIASWVVVTGVLLVVLLTNQLARVLQRAANNQYPHDVVLKLIGLGVLQNLGILVPVGLLLGIVLALGRLYHDSELTAAQACGVGPSRVYGPIAVFAVVIALLQLWISLSLAPAALSQTLALRTAALRSGQFSPIAAGRFRTFGGSDAVVYAERVNHDGTLSKVFVEREQRGKVEVALADRARHEVTPDGRTHRITLYDGERFEGVPGGAKFRIMRFAEHVIPVPIPPPPSVASNPSAMPMRALLASNDLKAAAELQWRIALPMMAVVLAVLAVPISRLRPRQGRYARVWMAILLYLIYSNLVSTGTVWIQKGRVPPTIGLWWTHAVVIALTVLAVWAPGAMARARARG